MPLTYTLRRNVYDANSACTFTNHNALRTSMASSRRLSLDCPCTCVSHAKQIGKRCPPIELLCTVECKRASKYTANSSTATYTGTATSGAIRNARLSRSCARRMVVANGTYVDTSRKSFAEPCLPSMLAHHAPLIQHIHAHAQFVQT